MHSIFDSSGWLLGNEGMEDSSSRKELEKQLMKKELRRFALEVGDSTVMEPLLNVCGIRSRLGDREWYIDQNCLGVLMAEDIVLRKVNLAFRTKETAKFLNVQYL